MKTIVDFHQEDQWCQKVEEDHEDDLIEDDDDFYCDDWNFHGSTVTLYRLALASILVNLKAPLNSRIEKKIMPETLSQSGD